MIKTCILQFSATLVPNIFRLNKYLARCGRVAVEMYAYTNIGLPVKCPSLLCDFK